MLDHQIARGWLIVFLDFAISVNFFAALNLALTNHTVIDPLLPGYCMTIQDNCLISLLSAHMKLNGKNMH